MSTPTTRLDDLECELENHLDAYGRLIVQHIGPGPLCMWPELVREYSVKAAHAALTLEALRDLRARYAERRRYAPKVALQQS